MKAKCVEATAIYKIGHQRLRVKSCFGARGIQRIEEVPPETPDSEGGLSRVVTVFGEPVLCAETFAELRDQWLKALSDDEEY